MQRKQLLAEIDRQSKKWEKEIDSQPQPYRIGFRDGVNKVKELIKGELPANETKPRRKEVSAP